MKHILFLFVLFCTLQAAAQKDTLFLVSGDTIVGRIVRNDKTYVEIIPQGQKEKRVFMRSRIMVKPKYTAIADNGDDDEDDEEDETYEFDEHSDNSSGEMGGNEVGTLPFDDSYLFFKPYAGMSRRGNQVPEGVTGAFSDFLKPMRHGIELGAQAGLQYRREKYFGIMAQYFMTSSRLADITIYDDTVSRTGTITTSANSLLIGPMWGRYFIREHRPSALGTFFSLGYSRYLEKTHLLYHETLKSQNIYFMAGLTYESNFLTSRALFATFSYIVNTFSDFEVTNHELGFTEYVVLDNIDMSRFNLSIGIRFK